MHLMAWLFVVRPVCSNAADAEAGRLSHPATEQHAATPLTTITTTGALIIHRVGGGGTVREIIFATSREATVKNIHTVLQDTAAHSLDHVRQVLLMQESSLTHPKTP